MSAGFGLTFHHLGLAVETAEPAESFLSGLGYTIAPAVYDRHQNVNLRWAEHVSMPAVEIITPATGPGPLDEILKRGGAMIYHICFATENLVRSLEALRAGERRVVCVVAPKPAPLFSDRPVGFYLVKGFGLIEIVEGAGTPVPGLHS
jgi:methylmalonyl-CoA/ethylmalonyl-CoA epimerase